MTKSKKGYCKIQFNAFLPSFFFLGGVGGEGKEEFVTESIPLLGSLTQKQPIFQRKKH